MIDREALQQDIEKLEQKLTNMKIKYEESSKQQLTYSHPYYKIDTTSIKERYINSNPNHKTLQHARYRDTKEQAEETLLRELQANRIEALARKIDPDWKEDWDNKVQSKYFIMYDNIDKRYDVGSYTFIQLIGVPYMSEQTARITCEYLNSGEYSLNIDDTI